MNTIDSSSAYSYSSYSASPPSPAASASHGAQATEASAQPAAQIAPAQPQTATIVTASVGSNGSGPPDGSTVTLSNSTPARHGGVAIEPGIAAAVGHSQSGASSDDHLKNTGVKTEIQIEKGIGVVVQLVQPGTGKVVMQSPPQGVIDMVAQIEQAQDKEMKIGADAAGAAAPPTADGSVPASGSLIDQLA